MSHTRLCGTKNLKVEKMLKPMNIIDACAYREPVRMLNLTYHSTTKHHNDSRNDNCSLNPPIFKIFLHVYFNV